jgi:hypothetical protein
MRQRQRHGAKDLGASADSRLTPTQGLIPMCGRVRLITEFSEIRIRLKFDPLSPAPNYPPDWNIPPTGRMLLAVRSIDGKRIAKIAKWGLIPRWAKDDKMQFFDAQQRPFGGIHNQARVPRRLAPRATMPVRYQRLLRVEEARP